jgi:hypothetical protein
MSTRRTCPTPPPGTLECVAVPHVPLETARADHAPVPALLDYSVTPYYRVVRVRRMRGASARGERAGQRRAVWRDVLECDALCGAVRRAREADGSIRGTAHVDCDSWVARHGVVVLRQCVNGRCCMHPAPACGLQAYHGGLVCIGTNGNGTLSVVGSTLSNIRVRTDS